jgi:hypothetical protein
MALRSLLANDTIAFYDGDTGGALHALLLLLLRASVGDIVNTSIRKVQVIDHHEF